jgi:hypothetical protein
MSTDRVQLGTIAAGFMVTLLGLPLAGKAQQPGQAALSHGDLVHISVTITEVHNMSAEERGNWVRDRVNEIGQLQSQIDNDKAERVKLEQQIAAIPADDQSGSKSEQEAMEGYARTISEGGEQFGAKLLNAASGPIPGASDFDVLGEGKSVDDLKTEFLEANTKLEESVLQPDQYVTLANDKASLDSKINGEEQSRDEAIFGLLIVSPIATSYANRIEQAAGKVQSPNNENPNQATQEASVPPQSTTLPPETDNSGQANDSGSNTDSGRGVNSSSGNNSSNGQIEEDASQSQPDDPNVPNEPNNGDSDENGTEVSNAGTVNTIDRNTGDVTPDGPIEGSIVNSPDDANGQIQEAPNAPGSDDTSDEASASEASASEASASEASGGEAGGGEGGGGESGGGESGGGESGGGEGGGGE